MRTSHLIRRVAAALVLLTALCAPPGNALGAPQAGSFTVNSVLDSNSADAVLTLREAILLANGGTGITGINRALTAGEQAQIAGCTISAGGLITGSCGLNTFDFIVFGAGIPSGSLLAVGSPLPPFIDPQGVYLNGGTVRPTIDATALALGNGLWLQSSLNSVARVGVKGAPDNGFGVEGNDASLYDVWAWNNGTGIRVDGNNAVINYAVVGVDPDATTCGTGNAFRGNALRGIDLAGTYAEIKNSIIGCNGRTSGGYGSGIRVQNQHNTLGPYNGIGTTINLTGTYPNTPTGILVETFAPCCYYPHYTKVFSNTIGNSGDVGLELRDANFARVGGNLIRANGGRGIAAFNSGDGIYGGPSLIDTSLTANRIVLNHGDGMLFWGPNAQDNIVVGNRIGSLDGISPAANQGDGVSFSNGAHHTIVGDPAAPPNLIGGNNSGVLVTGNSHHIQIANNLIGAEFCCLLQNSLYGILLSGTYSNTVKGNTIANNAFDGIAMIATSRNLVEANAIHQNARNGIRLEGVLTLTNTVRLGAIHHNGADGIASDPYAGNNTWSQLSVFANGGLGIDTEVIFPADNIRNAPNIKVQSVLSAGGTVTVTGTGPASAFGIATVELYQVDVDATGDGEGKVYLGSDTTDGSGNWRIVHNTVAARCYVAFYTFDSIFSSARSSSEFSLNSCQTYLPVIRR